MVLSDEGDDELARVPKRRNDVLLGPAGMLSGSKGSNGYSLNNRNVGRNLFSDISHLSPRPNAGIKRRRSVRLEREVRWRTRLLREGTLRALTNATHLGKELHCAVDRKSTRLNSSH